MRITYVLQARFPTEKAHGHQVAEVCDALSSLGHHITLVAPKLKTHVEDRPEAYYDLHHPLHTELLPTFDAMQKWYIPEMFAFAFMMRSYKASLRRMLRQIPTDLLYIRSPALLSTVLATGIPVILELHTLPARRRSYFARMCNRCALIVCLTALQKEEIVSLGVNEEKILVEHDGVDLERFRDLPSSEVLKQEFGLPADKPVIGYCGSLMSGSNVSKGVDVLIDALTNLPSAQGWIIGGPYGKEELMKHAQEKGSDVRFEGKILTKDVPRALQACDMLVYPAPLSSHQYFLRDTSPLKLFQYLASGKPIICADIPPVREVVDASVVTLVPPGDNAALKEAIQAVLQDSNTAQQKAQKGKELVKQYDWKARMQRIIDRIS